MRRHSSPIVVAALTILLACRAAFAADISCGQTIERTIERSGQSDTLSYDAGYGDVLSITIVPVSSDDPGCAPSDPTGPNFDPYWELFDPGGRRVQILSSDGRRCPGVGTPAACETAELEPTDTGPYTLVVTDSGKNCSGTYRVTVENVSDTVDGADVDPANPQCARFNDKGKPDGTQPIMRGEPLGGAIDEIGETDTFTFEGQPNEPVTIRLATSTGGTFASDLRWTLFGPDFDSNGSNAVSGDCSTLECSRTLGSAGVYTIKVFDSNEDATGDYTLTLQPEDATTTTTTTTTTPVPSTTTTTMQGDVGTGQGPYVLSKTLRRTPSSFAPPEKLGSSLASDGNHLVIGAPADQTQGHGGGAAFVVNLTDNFGHLDGTLFKPGGGSAADDFGRSVALLPGAMIAVGAPGADDAASEAGEVYLFANAPGFHVIDPPSPIHAPLAVGSKFGTSLFVTPGSNEVFVGAPAPNGNDGKVYLFNLDPSGGQWNLTQVFEASQAATPSPARLGDQFGFAIAATADQLAIGAPATRTAGRVFLFDRRNGTWQIVQSPTPTPGDGFGSALAYVNSALFIGAPGAAQVFQLTGSAQVPIPLDTSGFGGAGAALAPISGGGLFVGAPVAGGSAGGVVLRLDSSGQRVGLPFAKPEPDAQDQYGAAVATAGGRLFIGAPGDDSANVDGGAVYAYELGPSSSGTPIAIFRKRLTDTGFGTSVSANAAAIVVGAPTDAGKNGAVYMFNPQDATCTNDVVCQTIGSPVSGTEGSRFGQSVAMATGTVALVGAPFENAAIGAAYLRRPDSGVIPQIKNPEPSAGDQFGFTVAAVESDLLIAAPLQGTTDAGKVFVFDNSENPPRVILSKPVSATGDFFGAAIAGEGDTVAVGAPFDSTAGPHAGAVYLFSRSTGQLLAGEPLVSPNAAGRDLFGAALAMSADLIVVGAPSEDGAQPTAGRAYVFQRQSPDLPTSFPMLLATIDNPRCLRDSVGCVGDRFGAAVAIVDGQVLIGAPFADGDAGAQDTGVAYVVNPSPLTITRIENPAQGAFDRFGSSVASGPSGPIIGVPGPGRVYVYSKADAGTTSLAVRNALGATAAAAVASGPRCGDGIVDPGEQCDDGNNIDTDDCRNDCTLQPCCVIDPLAADRCNDFDPCTDDSIDANTGLCVNVDNGQCCTSDSSCAGDSACRLCAGCSLFPWDCCDQGSTCILNSPQCQGKTCLDEAACECSELTCSDESTLPDKRLPTEAMSAAFRQACVAIQAAQNGGATGNPMDTARTQTKWARRDLKGAMHETRSAYKSGAISKQCRAEFIQDIRRVRKSVPTGQKLRKCVTKSGAAS
jgi:cysteine-rich repeat protein